MRTLHGRWKVNHNVTVNFAGSCGFIADETHNGLAVSLKFYTMVGFRLAVERFQKSSYISADYAERILEQVLKAITLPEKATEEMNDYGVSSFVIDWLLKAGWNLQKCINYAVGSFQLNPHIDEYCEMVRAIENHFSQLVRCNGLYQANSYIGEAIES